jgi:archaellum component FlaC
MQSPSADPSFKAFLDKLKEQTGGGILAQKETTKGIDKTNESLSDLKDETSSVRDSLRDGLHDVSDDVIEVQDQLDTANDTLSRITTVLEGLKEVITGVKAAVQNVGSDVGKFIDSGHLVATMGAIGINTNKLQDEQLKEISLVRKLTEGSVEYDKEAAQYRNTSGRDIESKVSGKTSKDGGFLDFETARDTLSGQGERARKDNKLNLITSVTSTRPGGATAEALGGNLGDDQGPSEGRNTSIKRARRERSSVAGITGGVEPKEKNDEEQTDNRGFFATFKDEVKATPGRIRDHLIGYEEPPEDKKKEREGKVSSPAEKSPEAANPEGDNVTSSGEALADAAKSDLELSKQMLETTKEQLTTLKEIRDALAPKTPAEITDQKGAPSAKKEEEDEKGSLVGDLASGAMDLVGKKGGAGKVASMGGKLAKFATSNTGKVLGAAAAVGLGAYTAYEGYTAAEDSKQAKMEEVQAKFDSGEMKPEEAAAARKEIGNTATVEKSGAIGEGTGMAAGAIAGASLGATIGSIVPGVGTAIGGIAGGALGAFAGSKAGKVVGEYGGKAINAAGDFFGGIGDKVKGVYNSGIGLNDQAKGVAMADQMVSSTGEVATSDKSISRGPGLEATTSTASNKEGVTAQKSVLGSTFLGGLFTAKGKESGSFLGTSSDEKVVEGKVEGKQINKTEANYGSMLGQRISGGLFGKDTYKVSSEMSGTGGDSAEYDTEVTKQEYNQLQELNKKGDVEGARKKLTEIKEARAQALAPSTLDVEGNVGKGSPILTGKDVAKTSTENADMERDASKGGANNTVVSNNVSSNNTTKFMPSKPTPRPEYTGSALDRYSNKIAVY